MASAMLWSLVWLFISFTYFESDNPRHGTLNIIVLLLNLPAASLVYYCDDDQNLLLVIYRFVTLMTMIGFSLNTITNDGINDMSLIVTLDMIIIDLLMVFSAFAMMQTNMISVYELNNMMIPSFLVTVLPYLSIHDACNVAEQTNDIEQGHNQRRPSIILVRELKEKKPTEQNCAICLDDFTDENVKVLPCSHDFHTQCISKWMLRKPNCPICRTSFMT